MLANKIILSYESRELEPDNKSSDISNTLDKLVDEHYDYLYKCAFRYLQSVEKSEDIVQETFLAATEAITRFKGNSSYRTWLTSILRHKIMDKFRVKHREEVVDFQSMEQDPLSSLFDEVEHWHRETGPIVWGSSPEATLKNKEFLAVLGQCLGKLPAKIRQIFLLREVEGYDYDEICKDIDLTSANVRVVLHRARISLQHCLQNRWFHGEKTV